MGQNYTYILLPSKCWKKTESLIHNNKAVILNVKYKNNEGIPSQGGKIHTNIPSYFVNLDN
jgi:hypothetical protein